MTYTAHLYRSLKEAGHIPVLYRIRKRDEDNPRQFSGYDSVEYINISLKKALTMAKEMPVLIVSSCNPKHLFDPDTATKLTRAGARVVLHDPSEFNNFPTRKWLYRPIVIRPAMLKLVENAVFVPHPYVREFVENISDRQPRSLNAVCISRVTFKKRVHLILEANRLVIAKDRVHILGRINRMYGFHVLQKKFPEWKQLDPISFAGTKQTWGAGASECAKARFSVDMSWFPEDGGGSQYTFMEAWDAGTVNIVHTDWTKFKGEMKPGVNCIAVADSVELASVLTYASNLDEIQDNGYQMLMQHAPMKVVEQLIKEMNK